jgi:hypothetical protein
MDEWNLDEKDHWVAPGWNLKNLTNEPHGLAMAYMEMTYPFTTSAAIPEVRLTSIPRTAIGNGLAMTAAPRFLRSPW